MNYEIHLRPKGEKKNCTRVNIYQRYGLTRAGGSRERVAGGIRGYERGSEKESDTLAVLKLL